jgi:hypothetical protein
LGPDGSAVIRQIEWLGRNERELAVDRIILDEIRFGDRYVPADLRL